jgi:predicted TIM-barrel fold metal-dependent hydrolase
VIPIIDAHSQVCPENIDKVIQLMNQAGVACTILSAGMTSTRGVVTPEELVSFASNYPGRIIPAVRTKISISTGEDFYKLMEKQMNMAQFGAMAEVLMYHDALKIGTVNVPVIEAHPADKSVQTALKYALDKKWPFILHIEFTAAGSKRDVFMTELKALLVQYPEHPFVLIHMGQLGCAAVQQLIEAHENIYFITAVSTPPRISNSPWTNMFEGRNLAADWKQLIIKYPDRFIMGFDNVLPETWGHPYLDVVALWREAIKQLPVEVTHAFAHGNAERLWHLPPVSSATPTLTPIPATDTTSPSAITGLVANNTYDKRVNLWWDKSVATDFDHYNIFLSKTEMVDVTGMKDVQQIQDVATCKYQATGLEDGTRYYFAVTAVDKSGNESTKVTSVSATPTPMPKGTKDPDIIVDVYQPDKAWAGTTLLPDNHYSDRSRIIEVNMLGEIIWEYPIPSNLKRYTNPGFDVEPLSNGHILYVLPGNGVYEIDRSGKVVWSYLTTRISHDADRLPNDNTIFVCGNDDQKSDAQVVEVNPKGEVVWKWYARDYFDKSPYNSIYEEGWTHTNAVTRLPNGNTLLSPRNFNFLVEVGPDGKVVRTYGEGIFMGQHDPAMLENGNILLANHDRPHRAIEFDPRTDKIVWQSAGFEQSATPVRDANRLPNGNTLITCSTKIVEVTTNGNIVWQLAFKGITFSGTEAAGLGFYKAERISTQE